MSDSLYRLLKLAEAVYDSEDGETIQRLEAQFKCFARKHCVAHYRPHNDGKTPNPWRRQMDYAPWENSPYYGSISEFMERFPGGIPDWREWREKTKKERNQMWSEGPTKGEMGLKKASIKERMKRVTELTGISKEAADQQVVSYVSKALAIPERYLHTLTDQQLKNLKILVDLGRNKAARNKYTEYQIANQRSKKAHFIPVGPDDVKKFEKEPLLYSDEGLEEHESVGEFRKERKRWRESEARDVSRDVVKEFIDYWKLLKKVPEIRKKRRGRRKK